MSCDLVGRRLDIGVFPQRISDETGLPASAVDELLKDRQRLAALPLETAEALANVLQLATPFALMGDDGQSQNDEAAHRELEPRLLAILAEWGTWLPLLLASRILDSNIDAIVDTSDTLEPKLRSLGLHIDIDTTSGSIRLRGQIHNVDPGTGIALQALALRSTEPTPELGKAIYRVARGWSLGDIEESVIEQLILAGIIVGSKPRLELHPDCRHGLDGAEHESRRGAFTSLGEGSDPNPPPQAGRAR